MKKHPFLLTDFNLNKTLMGVLLLLVISMSSSFSSCNRDDDDDNTDIEPNGFLLEGEQVYVKYLLNGELWESKKVNGNAGFVTSTISINAENLSFGAMQIIVSNANTVGTYTLPASGGQFVSTTNTRFLALNQNYPGTSLTLTVTDAVLVNSALYSIKGTFSGTAFDTMEDEFVSITEGEFYGGGLE